jgi:hypothetical protein
MRGATKMLLSVKAETRTEVSVFFQGRNANGSERVLQGRNANGSERFFQGRNANGSEVFFQGRNANGSERVLSNPKSKI